jgi:nucleotide-binding universal stress UspA family protein
MPGIVVGVDGSVHAHRALDWAMREAAIRAEELRVLSVNPAQSSPWTGHQLTVPDEAQTLERTRSAVQEAVTEAAGKIGPAQPASVSVQAFSGSPAKALIEASREADMLVIGSRGAGGFESLLLGSISHEVVQHAACPVVVVPTGH